MPTSLGFKFSLTGLLQAGGAAFLSDSFTGTGAVDGRTPDISGSVWTATNAALVVGGGYAYINAGGNYFAYSMNPAPIGRIDGSWYWPGGNTGYGVIFRFTDTLNFWRGERYNNNHRIYRRSNGTDYQQAFNSSYFTGTGNKTGYITDNGNNVSWSVDSIGSINCVSTLNADAVGAGIFFHTTTTRIYDIACTGR